MTSNRRKIILFSLQLFSACLLFAQKEANIWCFGQQVKIDFNSGVPVSGISAIQNASAVNEGCSTMCNRTTGTLLFYTDGVVVYDRFGAPMPNGKNLFGSVSTTQSALIVPLPNSATKYLVFTLDAQAGKCIVGFSSKGLTYSMVDMTLNAGKGDVVLATKNTPLITPATEKMTAVRHCNGRDIWIIVHEWNSDAFYSYLVTPAGVQTPVISHAGIIFKPLNLSASDTINEGTLGAMKSSPNGKKLALATPYDRNTVEIYDYCNGDGIVSPNPAVDSSFKNQPAGEGLYGVAFSPDNSKLYISNGRDTSSGTAVYQYDMAAGSSAAIIASRQTIISYQLNNPAGLGEIGALELAVDGKIYASILNSGFFTVPGHLAAINNPNVLGAACTWVQKAVAFYPGTQSILGLSDNFGAGKFNGTTLDTTINCFVKGTQIQLNAKNHPLPCSKFYQAWSTGDTAAFIKIDTAGTYIANQSGCYFDTINVKMNFQPVGQAAQDTTICTGSSVQLNVKGGVKYSWSPATGLNNPTIANPVASPTGNVQYIVKVSSAVPCTVQDTVNIVLKPAPIPEITPNDTNIIVGHVVQLHASGGATYSWLTTYAMDSTHSANPFVTPQQTTVYLLKVTAANGCTATDTVTVFVHPKCDGSDEIFIPTAFSPNGDGQNDMLYLRQRSDCIKTFDLKIYDRWGELVFETPTTQFGWDGKFHGELMNTAVFVYVLHLEYSDGTSTDRKGNITLLR